MCRKMAVLVNGLGGRRRGERRREKKRRGMCELSDEADERHSVICVWSKATYLSTSLWSKLGYDRTGQE